MRSNKDVTITALSYPTRPNRYMLFGWNRNFQDCYDESDLVLLKKIQYEFDNLVDNSVLQNYFILTEETRLHDLWQCIKPSYITAKQPQESFTIPTRQAKDNKVYPLWNYADNMGRKIANWQSDRFKNQNPHLLNDPVMLIFEELKDWFLDILSIKECKVDVLEIIAARQSYLKNIIHFIPNFGPDRLRLHEIQKSLETPIKIIFSCIANKELPQFLSESIISGKSLETTLGTYLHFLLVNEDVSDNFSTEYLNGNDHQCQSSPVCKIYNEATQFKMLIAPPKEINLYQELNTFYTISQVREENNLVHIKIELKKELSESIKFADFVTQEDKNNYIDAIATLEALTHVRKILDHFQNILPRMGTYVFALNYLDKVDNLSANYIKLIGKMKFLMKNLLQAADNGLNTMLSDPSGASVTNHFFEKNLRALETKVAKGTTVNAQLEKYCAHATESMNRYQQAMKKLVRSINSGEASHELDEAMQHLFSQISSLNNILPGILGEPYLAIKKELPFINDKNDLIKTSLFSESEGTSHFHKNTFEYLPQNLPHSYRSSTDTTPVALPSAITPSSENPSQPPTSINFNSTLTLGFVLGSVIAKYAHRLFSSNKKLPKTNAKSKNINHKIRK